MHFPVKTTSQLRPLLIGFRKASGLTQADVAERMGVTQQTYAQLEAKPESASIDRLFRVLRLLNVDMTLSVAAPRASSDDGHVPVEDEPNTNPPGRHQERW